jgi:6-phosphogluconolactonase
MTRAPLAEVEVFADRESLARRVADWLTALAAAKDGRPAIALSGGSTPQRLYQLLAEPPWRSVFPWGRTHWFWGDERFVSPDDGRSNYHMVREALLSRAPIPSANVHAIPTEDIAADAAADEYESMLKSFYGAAQLDPVRPLFDITLLGLGPDGHTASLFPGATALAERRRWVATVTGATPEPRVTLTYPALESSRHVAFLVAGKEKRRAFGRLRRGDQALPAARLRPIGALHWFADAQAAGDLNALDRSNR